LTTEGPSYGYFANPPKTWLVTKDSYLQNAVKIFADSGVNITPNGRPYPGAALSSPDFIEEHLRSKVEEWTSNITFLSEIAKSQPHAAYSALVHGLSSRWSYLSRVTPNISHLLIPLDTALRTQLQPTLTGRPTPNDRECALFALPARHGGLGDMNPLQECRKRTAVLPTSHLLPRVPYP